MSGLAKDLAALARRQVAALRDEVLVRLPDGRALGHGDGYVPLLVQFTREDGAARGLRRMTDPADRPPAEHLSALEAIQRTDATLLTAPCGWGKTTFARHLALNLSGARLDDPAFNEERLRAPVPRHDDGDPEEQVLDLPAAWALLVEITGPGTFAATIEAAWPGFYRWREAAGRPPLVVLADHAERLGDTATTFLEEALAAASPDLRVVVLADSAAAEHWRVPLGMERHRLLPLNRAQRAGGPGTEAVPAGFHAAARTVVGHANVDDLADRWLAAHAPDRTAEVAEAALAATVAGTWPLEAPIRVPRHLGELIAAARLADRHPAAVAEAFARAPVAMAAVVGSVFRRWRDARRDALAETLAALPGDAGRRGALAAAAHAAELANGTRRMLVDALVPVCARGLLSPAERIRAGARLSELGDPRDLAELVAVTGGAFRMGSDAHPNSRPVFTASVADFRMGRYPVANALFAAFVAETGRPWQTTDGLRPDRANAPAVDLGWHDARAFCAWATDRWRREGRIGRAETVRLPTEPEWERAARGDLKGPGPIYPWGLAWQDDCANAEPTGHNATCAVGLFPAGASPYGCLDMAGQVWEWTSTLWGREMEAPSFAFPYRADDGREDAGAGPDVRRILRGGCFTGGPAKANCTYRGSLEPAGTWRGNGFRVVVAKENR